MYVLYWGTSGFVAAELIRQRFTLCVVDGLRADKAVEKPCLERKRGAADLALSFCTGAWR